MSTIKHPKLSAPELEYRLRAMSENHHLLMRDVGDFMVAVSALLTAGAGGDIHEEIMSDLVVAGLSKGMMIAGIRLHTCADAAENRLDGELKGGAQ